jgi:hypothetical protein
MTFPRSWDGSAKGQRRVQQCIDDTVESALPPAGETVARFSPRLAAGVGFLAVFLLLGGTAAVAVADPGGSHSNRGSGFDRGSGGGNGRGGPERHDRDRVGNVDSGKRGEVDQQRRIAESPTVRVGSGRTDVAEVAPSTAADAGETVPSGTGPGLYSGTGGSGSARAGAPSLRMSPPPVTVGNGREPGIRRGAPEPQWRGPAPQEPLPVAPPPPPPAAPAPAPPLTSVKLNPIQPVLTQRLNVAEPDDWQNPWWGLAGLLLIPCAGAALGYRQARAAHAAEKLRRP